MTTPRGTVVRAGRALERFAESGNAAPAVFGIALAADDAVSFALPLQAGRDLARYLLVYGQLFDAHVVFPNALLARTPGTPVVTGLRRLQGGPIVSEAGLAVLYALSIVAWFCIARRFGPVAALTTAAALLAYPGYVLLFHELASDALFAATFALVALLLTRAVERPTMARAAVLGLGVVALVLARPVGQVLLLLGLAPLLAARGRRPRVEAVLAFAVAAIVPLVGLAGVNAARADDFTVVRGGSASLLPPGTFVVDRIVEPDNGEASDELARAVSRSGAPYEPYRSRGIDLETFFSSGKLADARRPDRPLRPDVGLGQRLPPPRPRCARGDPRASRDVRPRGREGPLAPAPVAPVRAGRYSGREPFRRRRAAGRAGVCRAADG